MSLESSAQIQDSQIWHVWFVWSGNPYV